LVNKSFTIVVLIQNAVKISTPFTKKLSQRKNRAANQFMTILISYRISQDEFESLFCLHEEGDDVLYEELEVQQEHRINVVFLLHLEQADSRGENMLSDRERNCRFLRRSPQVEDFEFFPKSGCGCLEPRVHQKRTEAAEHLSDGLNVMRRMRTIEREEEEVWVGEFFELIDEEVSDGLLPRGIVETPSDEFEETNAERDVARAEELSISVSF